MASGIIKGESCLWKFGARGATDVISDLACRYNLSLPVAEILYNRGITLETAEDFLFGFKSFSGYEPTKMAGIEDAVNRLAMAIEKKEKILIFGDYDVDGVTASALAVLCLRELGANVNFYVPNRFTDGYGFSARYAKRAYDSGYKVIMTVDNGITAFEAAEEAKRLGVDLIITDHHRAKDGIPPAVAIVNPNQPGCDYPCKHLSGVGVVFKLMQLLLSRRDESLPETAYELLALGTIGDVVPLLDENRILVKRALNGIGEGGSIALRALRANGMVLNKRLSATDVAFSLVPQINALGRLSDPRKGVLFLLSKDPGEIEVLSELLLSLNNARKDLERHVLAEVDMQIAAGDLDVVDSRILVAANSSWPVGVIGLVASRLSSRYYRPAIVLTLGDDGIAKGSCRSIAGIDIFSALSEQEALLRSFGGHAQAAGLSLKQGNIPHLKRGLEEYAAKTFPPEIFEKRIVVDAHARLSEVNLKLLDELEYLEPFGAGNPIPTFVFENLQLLRKPLIMKGKHVKCSVFSEGSVRDVIFFSRPEIYDRLLENAGEPFSMLAQVSENNWNGRRKAELIGVDLAF